MQIDHCAVPSRTAEDAEAFFAGLLGLKRLYSFRLPGELAVSIFDVNRELEVIRYGNDSLHVEVYLTGETDEEPPAFSHLCLLVKDRDTLARKAEEMNLEVRKVPKMEGNSYYLFIRDQAGNRYEIKES